MEKIIFLSLTLLIHKLVTEASELMRASRCQVFGGWNYLGTYKTRADIDSDGRFGQSYLGGPRFEDQDGNSVWNELDFVYLGSPEPDLFGGLRNTLTYKNLDLGCIFPWLFRK